MNSLFKEGDSVVIGSNRLNIRMSGAKYVGTLPDGSHEVRIRTLGRATPTFRIDPEFLLSREK